MECNFSSNPRGKMFAWLVSVSIFLLVAAIAWPRSSAPVLQAGKTVNNISNGYEAGDVAKEIEASSIPVPASADATAPPPRTLPARGVEENFLVSQVQRAIADRDGAEAFALAGKLKACTDIQWSLQRGYEAVASTGASPLPKEVYQRDFNRLHADYVQCQSVADNLDWRRLELLRVAVDHKVLGASAELRSLAQRLGTADLTPALDAQILDDAWRGNMHSAFSVIAVASLGASEIERTTMLRAFQLASANSITRTAAQAYLEGLAMYRLPNIPEADDERRPIEAKAKQVAEAMGLHTGQ